MTHNLAQTRPEPTLIFKIEHEIVKFEIYHEFLFEVPGYLLLPPILDTSLTKCNPQGYGNLIPASNRSFVPHMNVSFPSFLISRGLATYVLSPPNLITRVHR
jgi:hypothetical protein